MGSDPARPHGRNALLARYRTMAEEASDIIVLHEGGRIVCATGALWRLLKRTPQEFENGGYLALVHPADLDEARKLLGTPPQGEIWRATYRVQHADGHYVWFEVVTRGVYDETTGEFLREISVGRDICERKANELRLSAAHAHAEAANRAKSAFLANMSHELRTPLNAVIGFADAMKAEIFGPLPHPRYGEYANAIAEAGGRLLGMVANILDVAKIESGKLDVTLEPVDAARLAAECIDFTRADAENARVTLSLSSAIDLVRADPRALRQILLNLLSNAVKFTQPGGAVSLEARRNGSDAVFCVRDTGCGMSREQVARLVRPFELACSDAALARNTPGAGLGLALARALVEAHGGTIAIDTAPGKGTAVTVNLPHACRPAVDAVA